MDFTTADWTDESNQEGAQFAQSLASAGDVNGDGYADVIIGAPLYDNGETNEGRASVYLGSVAGLAAVPAWTAESNLENSTFGYQVTGGDVNGDGFADVLVTSLNHENGQAEEGQAAVFHGSAAGLEPSAAWTVESDQSFALFGRSCVTGDVNGDGFADAVVGNTYYGSAAVHEHEGRVSVYDGSAVGLSTVETWTAESDQAEAHFGVSVSAGDVNGDGYGDLLVGANTYDNGSTNEGQAFLYVGSIAGLETSPAWSVDGDQTDANFAESVSSAGDVNSDGFDDVIVGAPFYEDFEDGEGRATLYLGSPSVPDDIAAWTVESNQVQAQLGAPVQSAGDVNRDGYGDVVVGCPLCSAGVVEEGSALVFLGSANGLDPVGEFAMSSGQSESFFGAAVAFAGDVDGDGFDDLLVGAFWYDNGESNEGRAFLFRGGCGDPLDTDGDLVGDMCDVCPGFDDAIDTDFDGFADGCDVCSTWFDPGQEDDDADGIGDACDPCPGESPDADGDGFCAEQDCDDTNPDVHPGASDLCDGLDNNCSGLVLADERDEDGDGQPICAGDCDDGDPHRFWNAVEVCNDIDDDCDGYLGPAELDVDGDQVTACGGDCDESTTLSNAKLVEVCGDRIDNNCDGAVDELCDVDGGTGCDCNGTGAAPGPPVVALALLLRAIRRRVFRRR